MSVALPVSRDLYANLSYLKEKLGYGVSFDVVVREIEIGGTPAAMVFVDGFVKDTVTLNIFRTLMDLKPEQVANDSIEQLARQHIGYLEVNTVKSLDEVVDQVLAGPLALLVDERDAAVIIDARTYPARSPDEPDLERVIRGSRDGLVETLVHDTALIRRRVRDPGLRVELLKVGRRSKTDVALMYIQDVANPKLVDKIKRRIERIDIDGIPMAEKTVEEFITYDKPWWNPFPVVRYTERPDVAAIHLFEGHVLVLVDTSPSIMILPVTLFHHLQHAEEYREDVLVGMYLRTVRGLGILASWLITPLWLAVALNPALLPPALSFIGPREPGSVPLFWQFVIAELGIDLIRIALIHTPNALASSLGFIGAVIFGQLATQVGLFANETVMYVVLAALGSFTTPSVEFGLAVRLMRLLLVFAAGLFSLPGIAAGLALMFIVLAATKSFGVPYLWPLLPFNGKALWNTLIRRPVPADGSRPLVLSPRDPDRQSAR